MTLVKLLENTKRNFCPNNNLKKRYYKKERKISPEIFFTRYLFHYKILLHKKKLLFIQIFFSQKGRRERYVGKERKVGKVGTGIVRKVPNTFKLVHLAPHVSK